MNQNVCANCQEPFEYSDRSVVALSGCSHRICRHCAAACEGEFTCPIDGSTSSFNKRKSFNLRTDTSRNRLLPKDNDPSLIKSISSGDGLTDFSHMESLIPRDESIKPLDTFGAQVFQSRKKAASPDENAQDPEGHTTSFSSDHSAPGFDARRSHRTSEVSSRSRQPARCELHPDHILDIICKNPKCQKYVCLECVAFGNHSVS